MSNILIGPAFPLRGGIANFNEALCRTFLRKGISSKIYSFSLQYPGFFFPGTTQYDNGKAPEGIIIEPVLNSINPFSWIRTARKIKAEEPGYVLIRYWLPFMAPCLGSVARMIKNNSRIKIIAIADNIVPHEKRMGDNALTRFFVNSCDAFVVLSDTVRTQLAAYDAAKPVLCTPHPVYDIFGDEYAREEACRHLGLDPAGKYMLFFGFIRKYKGLDLLLEAMSDERIKNAGIRLIIAGEYYEDKMFYEELIKKYALDNFVIRHTQYISKEEVGYFFSASDLVVQPYRSATQSGVTQIAYHFNKPMLVTNVGGLSAMVPDRIAGYVTEPDPAQITEAILDYFLQNRKDEFVNNVKEEKKKFQWDTFVDKIEAFATTIHLTSEK